jgi:hypothetical protein
MAKAPIALRRTLITLVLHQADASALALNVGVVPHPKVRGEAETFKKRHGCFDIRHMNEGRDADEIALLHRA